MSQISEKITLDDTPLSEQPSKPYQVYIQRWFVLFAFSTFSFANAFGFVQNSPILKLTASYYGVDNNAVVWLSNVYYVTYILFGMFSIRPLQMRLDYSLFFAVSLNTIGGWLKYFADDDYVLAFVSYTLLGMAQLFILAAPVYVADKWFPANERTFATSIGSFINQIGLNFAFIYVTIYFLDVTIEDNKQKQQSLNFMSAMLNTASQIICLIFIRDKPKTPPSIDIELKQELIIESFTKIFTKHKYVLDLLSLSIFLGISWTYTSVITVILDPYGFTQLQIGIIGLIFTLSGTVGGSIASIIIDAQVGRGEIPKYDFWLKLFMTIGVISLIIQSLIIEHTGMILTCVTTAFIGIGLNSYYPIAVSSYIETLYPSFGLVLITALIIASNAFGLIGNYILLLPIFENRGLWVLVGFAIPFYLYIMVFYRTKLVRLMRKSQIIAQSTY